MFKIIYLFDRQRERKREFPLVHSSSVHMPATFHTEPEAGAGNSVQGFHMGGRDLVVLNHHLLSSSLLQWEAMAGIETQALGHRMWPS